MVDEAGQGTSGSIAAGEEHPGSPTLSLASRVCTPRTAQDSGAPRAYSILEVLGSTCGHEGSGPELPGYASADSGDFLKDDLMAAAMDLLLAARGSSCLAAPEALAEPAARVRRVQAVLAGLQDHLGD